MHLLPTAHLRRIAWRLKDRCQPAKSFQRFRVLRALVGEDATIRENSPAWSSAIIVVATVPLYCS